MAMLYSSVAAICLGKNEQVACQLLRDFQRQVRDFGRFATGGCARTAHHKKARAILVRGLSLGMRLCD
jgi:hypothetical protein